ncbi:MAG: hypothetical protein JW706_06885, partial [Opitutales bacterium]|nr:hypothetical protein [Opitutales bacterium]
QAEDPTDCLYCSYATAMGGQALDLAGYPISEAIAAYRACLLIKGADCGERQVVRDLKVNRFR